MTVPGYFVWQIARVDNEQLTEGDIGPEHHEGQKKVSKLVIGFAAETENLQKNAAEKRKKKKCDWLVANDVSNNKVFGTDHNSVVLLTENNYEEWPRLTKQMVAEKLVAKITTYLNQKNKRKLKAI